jgi:hypothetical protein
VRVTPERRLPARRLQGGFALMALLAILATGMLYFLVNQLDAGAMRRRQDEVTTQALAQAKEALIAWSAVNDSVPGRLPCPEDTGKIGTVLEGQALLNCGNAVAVGRLPWRTLGLDRPRDGYGEPLWYVLSAGFRDSPINSQTPAALTIDGVAGSAVAIVFSPGPPLTGQPRAPVSAATPPIVNNYLDLSNRDGDSAFVTTGPSGAFNDRLLPISHQDLFTAVGKRVAGEVARALLVYYCGSSGNIDGNQNCLGPGGARTFPRPASFADASCLGTAKILAACNSAAAGNEGRLPANPDVPWTTYDVLSPLSGAINGTWFQGNGWRELVYYAVSDKCMGPALNCGKPGTYLSVNGTANIKVTAIVAGSALGGQGRVGGQRLIAANYLEGDNASLADNSFASSPISAAFNDIVGTIK